MDRLAAMRAFARVVESQNFTAVARESGVSQPTISKLVADLETHLGVRLLNRSTRSVSPTDEGLVYYDHCRRILDALDEAEASVGNRRTEPGGLVRIGAPVAFGRLHVVPRMKRFLDLYPRVSVDLVMADRFSDLVEEGIDLSVRIGELSDASLVARRVGRTTRVTVGAPDYFARHGEPKTPEDLADHNCLVYTPLSTVDEWHFEGPEGPIRVRVKGSFRANNSEAVREAAIAGLGIAVTPTWLFRDELERGLLKVVLHGFEPRRLPINIVYPSRRFLSAKVQALADFLAAEFRTDAVIAPREGIAPPEGIGNV
jgi:DNA-binding transcriptional LysR family regulator